MRKFTGTFGSAFIIISVMLGVCFDMLNINVSAQESAGDINNLNANQNTEILSVIPYIEKNDDGVTRSVPIDSREDIQVFAGTALLRIQVSINETDAQKYYGQFLYICRLKTYEDTTAVSSENVTCDFEVRSSESFTYPIDVYADFSNLNNGEIYNKFVVAAKVDENFVPVSEARYIDNLNNLSNKRDTPPVSGTKKGLTAIQMPGEARLLGVGHSTVTIAVNDFMAAESSANTDTYMFGGEEFYFNMDKTAEYDRKIKHLTNEGINVTAVIVISGDYVHSETANAANATDTINNTEESDIANDTESVAKLQPIDYLIHKNAAKNITSKPFYFGINTEDENGFKYFAALMSFIADRYVREDMGSGRIYNIILGSEIGNIYMNYCGQLDIEQYVKDYLRTLRIADSAVRTRFGGARVYVPFDNWFAGKPDNGYINKEIIDLLCEYSAKEGNFIWNVAYNAYNYDIYNLKCWNETFPADDYDTPVITMKNIEILCNYLNIAKKDYLPGEETRKIMLADQGFTSGGTSEEAESFQAASFVYAYIKAKYIPEITAFIYHGQVDNPSEEAGYFGLWTQQGVKKPIYDVFKFMDTDKESVTIEFAKSILNIKDFSEIAPLYSESTAPAIILTEGTGKPSKKNMNSTYIGKFDGVALGGFTGSANIGDIALETYEGKGKEKGKSEGESDGSGDEDRDIKESSFKNVLSARFSSPKKSDYGSIFKIYEPGGYLDLSENKYVGVNLRIDSDLNLGEDYKVQIILTLEAEQNASSENSTSIYVYEGIANINLNEDSAVYFDISDWDKRENVRKVVLAANPYTDMYSGEADTDKNKDKDKDEDDFIMYVQSITRANVSGMNFIRNIIMAAVIIILLIAAAWVILFIRARIIRERRKREREQRRKRQAARRRSPANRPRPLPPGNPADRNRRG